MQGFLIASPLLGWIWFTVWLHYNPVAWALHSNLKAQGNGKETELEKGSIQ